MNHELSYIDLFAGCGGLSLGLQQAGLRGLFAIEKSSDAFRTLSHNLITHFDWPSWLSVRNWDIYELLRDNRRQLRGLRGSIDLVVGGPPCQGFSSAGLRRQSDARNSLIHAYTEFVDLVRPRAILFENVRGFSMKFTNGSNVLAKPYSDLVLGSLIDLGYKDAVGKLIDVASYGVPQHRERFIVIATRLGKADSIFARLENERSGFLDSRKLLVAPGTKHALSDLERRHGEVDCPDSLGFRSGIVAHRKTSLQKHLSGSTLPSGTVDSHRFVRHTPSASAVFSRLLETAPRNKRLWGIDQQTYRFKKRNVTVLHPEKPSLTITTIPDDFVHYSEPRVMTVRECARLQTFPDSFEFKGPYTTGGSRRSKETPRYTQVGNAVPPLFAEQIGLALAREFER